MKTPAQWWAGLKHGDNVIADITARDAEHRAELLKVQDDLLQGANREVMAEALIERLRGELGEAKRVIAACAHVPCVLASMSRTPGAVPRSCGSCGTCSARKQLAAPPPAESTPVQRPQQAAPSGDEAKVRDAGVTLEDNRAVVRLAEAYPDINELPGPVLDGIAQALANHRREAYAAGNADGAREEREACEKLLRARADVAYVFTDLEAVSERKALHFAADAIARRGSEGK